MEAGKERLTRDTVRDSTRQEIEHLKRKNHDGSNWLPTFPWRSTASKKQPSHLERLNGAAVVYDFKVDVNGNSTWDLWEWKY